jgi:broad specificity phosphatase PhoE
MPKQEIWMIRHAKTPENERHIMIGHTDPPLSENGVQDAIALATLLADQPVSRLFCSPLQRTQATARQIAALHQSPLQWTTSPLLQEIHLGIMEGVSTFNAYDTHRELMDQALDANLDDFAFPNGERRSQVVDRWEEFLTTSIPFQDTSPVWVVTHGGLIGLSIAKALGLPLGAYRQFQPPHASITRLMVERPEQKFSRFVTYLTDQSLENSSAMKDGE